ncbi:Uncharacterized protein ALO78_05202 [Pseudomonas amygdali pv. ciccaronei]|nr:Uncharacterized protein ALO78_05202 [Pseudomonas amygdali pv. ciccaronei]
MHFDSRIAADQFQHRLTGALPRAQHQPALGQLFAKGLQAGQKLRRVKQRRAKQRLERVWNARCAAAGQHDIARREAGLRRADPYFVQTTVAQHRVNPGDRRVEAGLAVHLPGNPGQIIRPFMATGGTAQQAEIEHPPLFLEVHGEGKAAARVARRHQVAKYVMVDVSPGQQQFAVPLAVLRSFQIADGQRAERVIGLPCVFKSTGQRDAGWTKADTDGVRVQRVWCRVTHEIPVLRVGVKRCSWFFLRLSGDGGQSFGARGPDAGHRASQLAPIKADCAQRCVEGGVLQRVQQLPGVKTAVGQFGQHVKHQQAFAKVGVWLGSEKRLVQRAGMAAVSWVVRSPETDDERLATLVLCAAQIRRGSVVSQHQRAVTPGLSSRLPVFTTGLEAAGKYLDIGVLRPFDAQQSGAYQRFADSNAQGLTVSAVIRLDMHAVPLTARQPVHQVPRQLPVRRAKAKDVGMRKRQAIYRCCRCQQRDTGLPIQRGGADGCVRREMADDQIGFPVDHLPRHFGPANGVGSVVEKVPLHPRKPRYAIARHGQRPHEGPRVRRVVGVEQCADPDPQTRHR